MSIVTKSIVNADAEARYLSPGELDRIKSFVTSGDRRLRIAQTLTDSRERIVKQAGDQLFQKRPDVVSPGGNAYGEEMTALFDALSNTYEASDIHHFSGDKAPLIAALKKELKQHDQVLIKSSFGTDLLSVVKELRVD